jgi:ABC-type transport system involved in cytochrome c biogenesis permease subunit
LKGTSLPALRRAMLRVVSVASVIAVTFTVLGFALGAVWAGKEWGRPFSADPKEFGAVLVTLMFAAVTFTAWKSDTSPRLSQSISIAGGGFVLAAWFGANAWMEGFPLALTLIGFGGCAVCLALAVMTYRLPERELTS